MSQLRHELAEQRMLTCARLITCEIRDHVNLIGELAFGHSRHGRRQLDVVDAAIDVDCHADRTRRVGHAEDEKLRLLVLVVWIVKRYVCVEPLDETANVWC